MQDQLIEIQASTRFLNRHPIVLIEDAGDIALFDFSSGEGFDDWTGWAVCDGQSHRSTKNVNVETPNLTDRFIVMAGGDYAVGDTGGEKEHTLIIDEIPVHDHDITDPGHVHTITDPGHIHAGSSAPHTHAFTGTAHNHSLDPAGAHTHTKTFKVEVNADIDVTGGSQSYLVNDSASADSSETMSVDGVGDHTHVVGNATAGGSNANATATVTVASAVTGITGVNSSVTGIEHTDETGGGHAHENRPPYFAAIYVKRIG